VDLLRVQKVSDSSGTVALSVLPLRRHTPATWLAFPLWVTVMVMKSFLSLRRWQTRTQINSSQNSLEEGRRRGEGEMVGTSEREMVC
jgi:hypothetical protein